MKTLLTPRIWRVERTWTDARLAGRPHWPGVIAYRRKGAGLSTARIDKMPHGKAGAARLKSQP
ncbi:hypothetical protein [Sphingobium sp.]|uniref:hypothetical protein n=1 Tax=Sphingobium sp. TaxID=1912891 RepID=UPI003BB61D4C